MLSELKYPVSVEPERAWRVYRGGSQIDSMHGKPGQEDGHFPEEWILSIVEARNVGRNVPGEGLNRLTESGQTLKSLVEAHPEEMLGKRHAARWGASTAVLLKVIDAAERLSVQVHPDREMAKRLFGSAFGKTECWYILGGRDMGGEPAHVYAGFKPGVTRAMWKDVFDRQDIDTMLSYLHKLIVHPGDTILIKGGLPHAIGAGCLLMEIQEPTDYTIRTERTNVKGELLPDATCHQGLGFDTMFECFHYDGKTEAQLREEIFIPASVLHEDEAYRLERIVGAQHTPCFALERSRIKGTMPYIPDGNFAGLYVLGGSGEIVCEDGKRIALRPGSQLFVPAVCSPFDLKAESGQTLDVFICRGPQE